MSDQKSFGGNLLDRVEAKGWVDGWSRGERNALMLVLKARGFTVDEPTRARIEICDESGQLQFWLVRAVSADSIAEVFR
ncbi:hypothetical protein AB0B28_04655 [Glycomyces sp. NPDC046736]|uniref:hypothetical protein n=1 Tax=Glycomyces sp. NPDC046736 TaxID=3155615 RepID=UPI0033D5F62B